MAGPKPMLTELGIHHRLESCEVVIRNVLPGPVAVRNPRSPRMEEDVVEAADDEAVEVAENLLGFPDAEDADPEDAVDPRGKTKSLLLAIDPGRSWLLF